MTKLWMGTSYRSLLLNKFDFKLRGENVLEVGCHDGFLLSQIPSKRKVGIDLEPIKVFPRIEYLEGDFLKHDFNGENFDLVISIEVLEHVEDPEKFMQNLDKVISKGGRALLSVPSKNIKIFPYLFQSYIDKRWGHHYRRGYNLKELHSLFGKYLPQRKYKIISWNCPLWRTFYIPLKLLWKIFPRFTNRLQKVSVDLDMKFRRGKKGFFFIVVE